MRSTAVFLVAIALLLAASTGLQAWRDRGWVPYEPPSPVMWLQNAEFARRAALGFETVAADVYWIRAVVYYGRQRLTTRADKTYDQLYPLLDLVTTLDPRFMLAYRFGAIFLSEKPPGGPNRPDLAVALLERAATRMPGRWEPLHDIGFVHALSQGDYATAASWFERASLLPQAPIWLKSTAAAMRLRGGDRAAARQLWQQFYDHADVEALRRTASIHLAQYDAFDQIDRLNEILWRYEAQTGRIPQAWTELVAAGVLRDIPLDPAGVPYHIDPIQEAVGVAKESPLWPLPDAYFAPSGS